MFDGAATADEQRGSQDGGEGADETEAGHLVPPPVDVVPRPAGRDDCPERQADNA
jgi:hypothetical protein